jgi:hypothetical protein
MPQFFVKNGICYSISIDVISNAFCSNASVQMPLFK